MDRLRTTPPSLNPPHGQSDILAPDDDEIMQLRRAFGLLAVPHTREAGVFCSVSELLAERSSRDGSAVDAPPAMATPVVGRSQEDVALIARRARGALVRRALVAVCGEGSMNVRRGLELAFPRADWDRLRRGLGERAAWAHDRAPAAASTRSTACSREPSADGHGLVAFVYDLHELQTLQVQCRIWISLSLLATLILSSCVCPRRRISHARPQRCACATDLRLIRRAPNFSMAFLQPVHAFLSYTRTDSARSADHAGAARDDKRYVGRQYGQ